MKLPASRQAVSKRNSLSQSAFDIRASDFVKTPTRQVGGPVRCSPLQEAVRYSRKIDLGISNKKNRKLTLNSPLGSTHNADFFMDLVNNHPVQ